MNLVGGRQQSVSLDRSEDSPRSGGRGNPLYEVGGGSRALRYRDTRFERCSLYCLCSQSLPDGFLSQDFRAYQSKGRSPSLNSDFFRGIGSWKPPSALIHVVLHLYQRVHHSVHEQNQQSYYVILQQHYAGLRELLHLLIQLSDLLSLLLHSLSLRMIPDPKFINDFPWGSSALRTCDIGIIIQKN